MVGNPPQTFGRYYVQGLIADGTTGPVYRAEDPGTRVRVAVKAFQTHLPPNVTRQIVDELNGVVDRLPPHPAIVSFRAAALKNLEPLLLSELAPGEPLDQALQRYGPGAIVDLLPRLHAMAEGLDVAAENGICHGALRPKDVMVAVDSTVITGIGIPVILANAGLGIRNHPPYTAPEVAKGAAPSNASDQFSLAAIAFEWLFGQQISGPARKRVKTPALPDVNGEALANAFTTALASSPSARFASCRSFVDAISVAVYGAVEPAVVEPIISLPVEPAPVASTNLEFEPAASIQVEAEPVASMQVEPEPAATTPVDPEPITTMQVESEPVASAQIEAVAAAVKPITDAHVAPVTTPPVEPINLGEFEPETSPWVEPFTITGHNEEVSPEFPVITEDSPNADLEPFDWQGLTAGSPFMETLFEPVPDTSIPSETPRMIEWSPVAATLFESIPDTPIPSATPLVIAPWALAETSIELVPEAPIPSVIPLVIAPSSLVETPIELAPDTPIPSATPLVIAPSPTVERPVAGIAKKPIRSVRPRIVAPASQEFSNAVIFALSTDGGRGFALALATTLLLGIAVGFGGGYAVADRRPLPPVSLVARAPAPAGRAAETWPPVPVTPAQNVKTAATVPAPSEPVPTSKSAAIAADSKPADPKPVDAKKAAPETVASRLLIRSTPTGATVQVDGVNKGLTPVELTGLELGSRTVSLSRPGYVAVERRVTLSKSSPARSMDVALVPVTPPKATAPARVAALPARPAVAALPAPAGNGSLVIESQPPGATVTVNGMARGKTPITIGVLPAGNYTLTMTLPKYQPVSMTVQVTPGERARAASTLTSMDPERR